MTKSRALLASTILGTGLLLAAGNANATAYAYANINFSNLTLSNLGSAGVSIDSASVSTRDSAGYPNYVAASNPAGATDPSAPLTAGSDAPQSVSGPGPFPGENTYTQALLNSAGARGDAIITGNLITGQNTGAQDVAEGRLVIPGSASSTAGTSTGFNINLTVGATTMFTLSFTASDSLVATTTDPAEFASASVSASFSVKGTGSTSYATNTYSPDTLNTSVSSTGMGQNSTTNNASAPYSFSVTLNPGTYQFSLLSGAQEQVTAPTPVPEPLTLTLLGSGLVITGLVRRRRK